MLSLDDLLSELNRSCALPALVAIISDADGVTAAGATGVRRLGSDDQARADDRFHIGSVTKPMISAMVATLVDDGLVDWADTPGDILGVPVHPTLRDASLVRYLAHRSGVAAYTEDEDWEPLGDPTLDTFAAFVLQGGTDSTTGDFDYSNAGFAIAAAVAERVGGTDWATLLRTRVFAPLGMAHAGVGWPPPPSPAGHRPVAGGFVIEEPDARQRLPVALRPAGDLHMTAFDLAAFGRAELATLVAGGTGIEVYREMGFRPGVSQRIGFAGSAGSYTARLHLEVARGRAVVVLTNAGDEADAIGDSVLPALLTVAGS